MIGTSDGEQFEDSFDHMAHSLSLQTTVTKKNPEEPAYSNRMNKLPISSNVDDRRKDEKLGWADAYVELKDLFTRTIAASRDKFTYSLTRQPSEIQSMYGNSSTVPKSSLAEQAGINSIGEVAGMNLNRKAADNKYAEDELSRKANEDWLKEIEDKVNEMNKKHEENLGPIPVTEQSDQEIKQHNGPKDYQHGP